MTVKPSPPPPQPRHCDQHPAPRHTTDMTEIQLQFELNLFTDSKDIGCACWWLQRYGNYFKKFGQNLKYIHGGVDRVAPQLKV